MDNLNLDSDESIIHKTQTVVISGVRYEAILTSRRFILVECDTGKIHEDLLLSDIVLAVACSNYMREPVLALNVKSPDGEIRNIELRFIRNHGMQNFPDRDACITLFREHNVPVRVDRHEGDSNLLSMGKEVEPDTLEHDKPATRPQVPEFVLLRYQSQTPQPDNDEPMERSPWITVVAIILVIAVVLSTALIMGGRETPANKTPIQPTVTVVVTPAAVTASPTPIPTPEVQIPTGSQQASAPVFLIPQKGVWMRVQYPGNYRGYISTFGRNIDVNRTGTWYYQLPIDHGPIDAFIEKQDGSVDKMELAVYKDETLIAVKNTTKPLGVVDFHTQV